MNVRLYDQGVDTIAALGHALQSKTIMSGTLENSAWSSMIDVRDQFDSETGHLDRKRRNSGSISLPLDLFLRVPRFPGPIGKQSFTIAQRCYE